MLFLLFLFTGLLGGSTGTLVKYLVEQMPPMSTVVVRFAIGLLIILAVVRKPSVIKKAYKNKQLILGSIFFAANVVFYAFGIQYTSLIMGSVLYVPTALIVAAIGYIFLKETLNRHQVIGLGLALGGMSILIYGSIQKSDILSFGTPLGNILIGIAVFSWSAYTVISRRSSHEFKPNEITLINFLYASIFTFAILPIFSKSQSQNPFLPANPQTLLILILAAIVALFFIIFYQLLVKKTSAVTSSIITYLNPVVASSFGIIFFKEKLTPSLILGGVLIFVAVFYSTTYQYIKKKQ